jgi:hypothetical protein
MLFREPHPPTCGRLPQNRREVSLHHRGNTLLCEFYLEGTALAIAAAIAEAAIYRVIMRFLPHCTCGVRQPLAQMRIGLYPILTGLREKIASSAAKLNPAATQASRSTASSASTSAPAAAPAALPR